MRKIAILTAALLALPGLAHSQTSLFDQTPAPTTSANGASELISQYYAVSGGTLYMTAFRPPGQTPTWSFAQSFVPTAAGGMTRYLALTSAKSDLGVPMTAAAGTPSGTVGISRTAGSSMTLIGEATSGADNKTDKALFEFNLPDSYKAGSNIVVTVNCNTTGTVITANSTTMTVAAYTESNAGVEAALSVSAAQQIAATAGDLAFTITGTGLVPGQHVAVELTMLVTTGSGAAHGIINSVRYGA